ncbi:MAG: glycosyltransferase family 4 protein [Chloroflexia bacterium]
MAFRNLDTRRLRVLYFIGSYGPDVMGNASHEETVLALRERGHSVDVFTQVTRPGEARFRKEIHSGVPTYSVNLAAKSKSGLIGSISRLPGKALTWGAGRFMQYEYIFALLNAYKRHLSRYHYDLVHVEGAYPFGWVAAQGSGKTPYIVNVQGADVIDLPDYDYGYRRFKLPRLAVKQALDRASVIRVISDLLGDYLVTEKLAERDKIRVILRAIEDEAWPPMGVSLEEQRAKGRSLLAHKYGAGESRNVVMALSRLHPFKGLEYLVDAMKPIGEAMRADGKEEPWLIIGGPSRTTESYGDYREFLRNRAEKAGVASHVLFTGQVEHSLVRDHLAGADVFVCPSILEAQNKVVPEAAAVGTPSVVTETTGIASYLKPMDACVSIPPRSAEAIAEAILRLLRDPDYYARISENALRAADTLRVEEVAPHVEEAWYEATDK